MPRREVISSLVSGVIDANPLPKDFNEAGPETQHYVDFLARSEGKSRDQVWRELLENRARGATRDADIQLAADIVTEIRRY